MTERLCPFGDGRHQRKSWASWPGEIPVRSGLACVRCSKTWEHRGDELVSSYADVPLGESLVASMRKSLDEAKEAGREILDRRPQ